MFGKTIFPSLGTYGVAFISTRERTVSLTMSLSAAAKNRFFPAGIPHSIQAFDDGVEFLLVFDSGEFSEDGTFLVSELFERNPKSVLAKDLRVDTSAFDHLPSGQLYILPGTPAPKNISEQNVTGPAGSIPSNRSYSYHFSQQEPYEVPGGSVKLLDSTTFPIAKDFAVGLFTIKPGAMRE